VPLLIFAVLAVGVALLLNRTAFGLRLYLMGTNPLASRFAGIDNFGLTVRTYLLSGTLAAMAGVVLMSRANSAKADYGTSYLLLSILIAVLGGINPYGGFGKVGGLVLAVLSLQFLSSGFNMLQFSNFAKEFIWGALLLLVMVVNGLKFGRQAQGVAAQKTADTREGKP
jgi:simple sugar transport system permease protein